MKPTMEILERIKKNSEENKDEVFTRIYRDLLRPDIYFVVYQNLYSNNGASTKGVDDDTADGFSEAKIERIIKCLEDESYQPKPFRRVCSGNSVAEQFTKEGADRLIIGFKFLFYQL